VVLTLTIDTDATRIAVSSTSAHSRLDAFSVDAALCARTVGIFQAWLHADLVDTDTAFEAGIIIPTGLLLFASPGLKYAGERPRTLRDCTWRLAARGNPLSDANAVRKAVSIIRAEFGLFARPVDTPLGTRTVGIHEALVDT